MFLSRLILSKCHVTVMKNSELDMDFIALLAILFNPEQKALPRC